MMNPESPRFWPQDPGRGLEASQPDGPQPEEILRAAAAELGPATGNEVVAELGTRSTGDSLMHQFYLVAKPIDYRYLLFRVRHHLGFPVTIFDCSPIDCGERVCTSADELEQTLRELFESAETQRIVGQLRNLSQEAS